MNGIVSLESVDTLNIDPDGYPQASHKGPMVTMVIILHLGSL